MSDEEREQFGLSESERRSPLRVDSAKINIAPPSIEARWFRLVGIRLGNSTDLYPRGDEVPTAEPWKPPNIWGSLTNTVTNQILDAIQAGPSEGRRYTDANRAGDRAAWRAVAERCPSLNEKQARKVITTWLKSGMIEARDYDDRIDRKPRSLCPPKAETPPRAASVLGGVPVCVERQARRQRFAGFRGKQYLAPHQRCRADIENDGPVGRRKAQGVGLVPRAGRVAPGGTMCGEPLAV
jgi:hypothetical protein